MTDPVSPPHDADEPLSPSPARSAASRRVSPWWRALAVVLGLALLLGWAASVSFVEQLKAQVAHLQTKLQVLPQVREISVLLDDQQRPALLITHDPSTGVLQVQRLNSVAEGREDSMQLWALNGSAQAPRSLGLFLSQYKTLQLPLKAGALEGIRELAISVESKGGVTDEQGPRLPYLFRGALVHKAI